MWPTDILQTYRNMEQKLDLSPRQNESNQCNCRFFTVQIVAQFRCVYSPYHCVAPILISTALTHGSFHSQWPALKLDFVSTLYLQRRFIR